MPAKDEITPGDDFTDKSFDRFPDSDDISGRDEPGVSIRQRYTRRQEHMDHGKSRRWCAHFDT